MPDENKRLKVRSHRANSLLANNDLQWPVDWMGSPAGDPEC